MNTPLISRQSRPLLAILGAWFFLTLLAILFRHVTAVDETRYLSAAWEMWVRGDFLVPHLNGEPYHHKPPLLFWLIHAFWYLFGVSDWAARLVLSLLGLTGVLLVIPMATLIWPDRRKIPMHAAWVVLTFLFWMIWNSSVMFDLLVAVCAEIAWLGLLLVWRGRSGFGWLLAGVGMGLGILAKGPVIFVYVLPGLLFAPWWMRESRPESWLKWYLPGLGAILLAAAIGLSWAIPAAAAGGEDYANHILWGQTAGRVVNAFAHRRPLWWYLPLIPVVLYPWVLWLPLWHGMGQRWRDGWDSGERFSITIGLTGLVIFSLISSKQFHYMLPFMPVMALFFSRALQTSESRIPELRDLVIPLLPLVALGLILVVAPYVGSLEQKVVWLTPRTSLWGVGILLSLFLAYGLSRYLSGLVWPGVISLTLLGVGIPGMIGDLSKYYSVREIALEIRASQEQGRSVAVIDKYHGEFTYVGRLTQPIDVIKQNQVEGWLEGHQGGLVVVDSNRPPQADDPGVRFWTHYRGGYLMLRARPG
jgi:4-amino-4-deoxy-L-arabinose transferase-like glycosyltransferase